MVDTKTASYRVLFAVGGTGGHILPALQTARLLQQKHPEILVVFAGKALEENALMQGHPFPIEGIPAAPLRLKAPWTWPKMLLDNLRGMKRARAHFQKWKIDAVVGFGSFHALPLMAAAVRSKIPLWLFESNRQVGRVNRLFSPYARGCATCFPGVFAGRERWVRFPTRFVEKIPAERAFYDYFSLDSDRKTLLCFGGSQGAQAINPLLVERFSQRSNAWKSHWQVLHFCGHKSDPAKLQLQYDQASLRAKVKTFEEKMERAWALADTVIMRSGGASIAEQIVFEVPAIYIPFPFAQDDHQKKNAAYMESHVRAGICVDQSALCTSVFDDALTHLTENDAFYHFTKRSLIQYKLQRPACGLEDMVWDFLEKI